MTEQPSLGFPNISSIRSTLENGKGNRISDDLDMELQNVNVAMTKESSNSQFPKTNFNVA